MERETGIEPATNSLEGCDSTTELLPPTRLTCSLSFRRWAGKPAAFFCRWPAVSGLPAVVARVRAKDGGEGRTRTFEAARATDLQSAAFDRFATSPTVSCAVESVSSTNRADWSSDLELAKGFEPPTG